MTVEFKFQYKQAVRILPMDGIEARVIQVLADERGRQYDVRYFHNGDPKNVWLFEDELDSV